MTFKSAADKHQYVNTMFGRIAHRYDTMNRLMSGGQDRRWRQLLLQQAQLPPGGKLLDIATGTGDIAFEALQQYPNLAQVVGADFTLPMLKEATRRGAEGPRGRRAGEERNGNPKWSGADALHLPFPDN